MNIPTEIVTAFLVAMFGVQAWILKEIVSLKVKMAEVPDLKKRVEKLEAALTPIPRAT